MTERPPVSGNGRDGWDAVLVADLASGRSTAEIAATNPSVSVSAARTILQGLVATREHDELVARIEALEAARGISPSGAGRR